MTPEGELVLAGGPRLTADLVVAADGVNSKLRDSMDCLNRDAGSLTVPFACRSSAQMKIFQARTLISTSSFGRVPGVFFASRKAASQSRRGDVGIPSRW